MAANIMYSPIVPELADREPENLKEFAALDHPELYDLKRLMVRYYNISVPGMRSSTKETLAQMLRTNEFPYVHEGSSLEQFLRYRKADRDFAGKKFDCDNSNATCDITYQLYRCLWGWPDGKAGSWVPMDILTARSENMVSQGRLFTWGNTFFGGETMNSVSTTLRIYQDALAKPPASEIFASFAQLTHCIGNLVLVPYGLNRGRYGITRDFWDASLTWLQRDGFQDLKPENFIKYVNFFYLWDFVSGVGKDYYQVKPLFGSVDRLSDRKRWAEIKPEEIPGFCNTVCRCIRRRGKFMAMLLYLNTQDKLKQVSHMFSAFLQGEDFLQKVHANAYQTVCSELKRLLDETENQDDILRKRIDELI